MDVCVRRRVQLSWRIAAGRVTRHFRPGLEMNRVIEPELLDELSPDDPRARWSRCDLRRINTWMRNHRIMANALQSAVNGYRPQRIVDLGAGDGHLMLRVARRTAPRWQNVNVTLLDRQEVTDTRTLTSFRSMGWRVETVEMDLFDWVSKAGELDVVVANLFLHHFEDSRLVELFRVLANHARVFVAIEPRRAPWPLFCCHLLWAIGCNSVTRHDAAISVRAGFSNNELSRLWPGDKDWQLRERRTGFFSHLFAARRTG